MNPGQIYPTSVSVSKLWDSNRPATFFIDHDISTYSVALVSGESVWVDLNLGGLHYIHRVTIYYNFYTDWWPDSSSAFNWCQESLSNWDGCTAANANPHVSVFANGANQKLCGTLQISSGLTQKDHIYTFLCHSKGDAVRMHKASRFILFADIIVDTNHGKYTNKDRNDNTKTITHHLISYQEPAARTSENAKS